MISWHGFSLAAALIGAACASGCLLDTSPYATAGSGGAGAASAGDGGAAAGPGGAAGGSPTTTSSTSDGTTTSSSTAAPECEEHADCPDPDPTSICLDARCVGGRCQDSAANDGAACSPDDPPCHVSTCMNGVCVTTTLDEGTPAPDDVDGDCHSRVCDANGDIEKVVDDTDEPADLDCVDLGCEDGDVVEVDDKHGTFGCTLFGFDLGICCGDKCCDPVGSCTVCDD